MDSKKRVIVIGAGPAGTAASLSGTEHGAFVTLFEHKDEPLKKLLLTGNGRCNFSNTDMRKERYHGDRELVSSVISRFSCGDMLDFMEKIGVEAAEVHYRFGSRGYFYPSTNRASTVRDALLKKLGEKNIDIVTGCKVLGVSGAEGGGFNLDISVDGKKREAYADSIVFATGSNAAPETGSDSSIYGVLKSMGIGFKTFLPALCAIRSHSEELRLLKGMRADCEIELFDETLNMTYGTEPGEVQFNERSVSGIPVMQLSRFAAEGIAKKRKQTLIINILRRSNGKGESPLGGISLPVSGTDGFDKAQCCTGGVMAECIDKKTLMCKTVPGIYFAGEMIDVDGECGGYNLHFAFATGMIAGRYVAL